MSVNWYFIFQFWIWEHNVIDIVWLTRWVNWFWQQPRLVQQLLGFGISFLTFSLTKQAGFGIKLKRYCGEFFIFLFFFSPPFFFFFKLQNINKIQTSALKKKYFGSWSQKSCGNGRIKVLMYLFLYCLLVKWHKINPSKCIFFCHWLAPFTERSKRRTWD